VLERGGFVRAAESTVVATAKLAERRWRHDPRRRESPEIE
jgi:hypothetical protein